ncbi:hypothetical protein [Sutcliffiella cohnii]|uniref:hypothetical protein n=1 Tax=Sutcliffiella cohnii TaxID=33932 RepID=UPI002E24F5EB|nr:hypothetical protein [Sutcliffiella cohnii]
MKNNRYILLIFALFLFLSGCNKSTPEQLINKKFKGELVISDLIGKQEVDSGSVFLFKANNIKNDFFGEILILGYLLGNEETGWEIGDIKVEDVMLQGLSTRHKILNEIKTNKELPVSFGKFTSEEINSIEVTKDQNYKDAKIYTKNSDKYYMEVNSYYPILTKDKNGEIIEKIGH